MKQISEGETTTSSSPAFMGLTTASLMAPTVSSAHGMTADDLYHTARPRARHRHWTNVLRQSYSLSPHGRAVPLERPPSRSACLARNAAQGPGRATVYFP